MKTDPAATRIEEDLLGSVTLPAHLEYGIQTWRACRNFPRKRQAVIGAYPNLIKGLLWIKQAAAQANERAGYLAPAQARAIVAAADQVLEGDLEALFPVHRLHGGGGTSANMNANEVLSRKARQILHDAGSTEPMLPCGHVNLHQSTNDVYPAACHIATILEWQPLHAALEELEHALHEKARAFAHVSRLARTCLQDAVTMNCGDFFSAYAAVITRHRLRLNGDVDRLHSVNLGGTIIGDASAVPAAYLDAIIPALREVSGDPAYTLHENLFDAAQNPDDMIAVASNLDSLARSLIKIGKDIRLLASGPETGLREFLLPAVQPGSSAMPDKVNPVIPEFLIQSCMDAIGRCHAAHLALDHGELDLNIWESLIVCNILDAMDLLEQAVLTFTENCVMGLKVNKPVVEQYCSCTTALAEQLSRKHGYETISALCHKARANGKSLHRVLTEAGLV
ncbi:aspartate ammonia-lyase [Desulfosarcina sp. OttesenSCG-928-A07]|nr:aspartate ammonia-lyase [Desulfosarcina sp. OttesenSCG-928-G17]MDL2328155.1 aspartate ammonia-lyase [Desulfosarcina sp. OttesenSCG-928-A07]